MRKDTDRWMGEREEYKKFRAQHTPMVEEL